MRTTDELLDISEFMYPVSFLRLIGLILEDYSDCIIIMQDGVVFSYDSYEGISESYDSLEEVLTGWDLDLSELTEYNPDEISDYFPEEVKTIYVI